MHFSGKYSVKVQFTNDTFYAKLLDTYVMYNTDSQKPNNNK